MPTDLPVATCINSPQHSQLHYQVASHLFLNLLKPSFSFHFDFYLATFCSTLDDSSAIPANCDDSLWSLIACELVECIGKSCNSKCSTKTSSKNDLGGEKREHYADERFRLFHLLSLRVILMLKFLMRVEIHIFCLAKELIVPSASNIAAEWLWAAEILYIFTRHGFEDKLNLLEAGRI